MIKRHDDLTATVNAKIADLTEVTRKSADLATNKIKDLQETVATQQAQIEELLENLKKGDITARNAAKEAIRAANAVEAHNRRWASWAPSP